MINTRKISWEILNRVFFENAYSNLLLAEISANQRIGHNAKNFIFALTLGTINKKIYLEHIANKFFDPEKTPKEIKSLIWLSIYQIKYMNKVPSYAIVNEAVELSKTINKKFAGFVNGLLKGMISMGDEVFEVNVEDKDKKFCIENSFPFELYQMVADGYGVDNARSFVLNSTKLPDIDIRVNTLKIGTKTFFERFSDSFKASKIDEINDALTLKRFAVKSIIYREGLITVQDKASILVGQILNPKKNSRVLDMCSAPGGKLTHLSALMRNTGHIKAYELNSNRLPMVQDNIARLGATNVELVNEDARWAINDEPYDYILLDAPCSGFGVLKRKPEIKINYNYQQLPELYKTQSELLEVAYSVLKYQGQMVYSTCTVNKAENEDQITNFIEKHPDMKILQQTQLFGDELNSDAFFICKMVKR